MTTFFWFEFFEFLRSWVLTTEYTTGILWRLIAGYKLRSTFTTHISKIRTHCRLTLTYSYSSSSSSSSSFRCNLLATSLIFCWPPFSRRRARHNRKKPVNASLVTGDRFPPRTFRRFIMKLENIPKICPKISTTSDNIDPPRSCLRIWFSEPHLRDFAWILKYNSRLLLALRSEPQESWTLLTPHY